MSTAREALVAGGTASRPGLIARRPEIVPVTTTVLAWAALAATAPLAAWTVPGGQSTGWRLTDGQWTDGQWTGAGEVVHAGHDGVFTVAGLTMIALMTVAMMGPLAIPGVRTVAFTSLWWRAGRAVACFFAAFCLSWVLIAIVLAPFAAAVGRLLGDPATAAGVLLLACAVAEFDPRRRDLTTSCDRPMRLRASGSDANSDCARFGLLTAWRGLRLCVLPMAAMLAVPASLLVMALVTAAAVTDRVTLGRRRLPVAAGYLVLGAVLLI